MWLFYALSSLIFSNIAMFPVKDIVPKDISTSGKYDNEMSCIYLNYSFNILVIQIAQLKFYIKFFFSYTMT